MMPFNFRQYEQQCSRMSNIELRREIEHHNETIEAAGAGTGLAVLAIPLTLGLSTIAVGATAPAIVNARKKRAIAKKFLEGNGFIIGPTLSTQPDPHHAVTRRPEPSRSGPSEEQLPVYTPVDTSAEAQQVQKCVPFNGDETDLPPSYDEATIKRMTMMGLIPPPHIRQELASIPSGGPSNASLPTDRCEMASYGNSSDSNQSSSSSMHDSDSGSDRFHLSTSLNPFTHKSNGSRGGKNKTSSTE